MSSDDDNDWDTEIATDEHDASMEMDVTEHSLLGKNKAVATEGAHSCSQCSYTCDDESALASHLRDHSIKPTLSCSFCVYRTLSETHYNRHVLDHQLENNVPLQSPQIDSEEDDWQMSYNDNDKESSNKRHTSAENSRHALTDHNTEMMETNDRNMRRNKSTNKESLGHIQSQSSTPVKRNDRWYCPVCKYSNKRKYRTKVHMESHDSDMNGSFETFEENQDESCYFQCSSCSKVSVSETEHDAHVRLCGDGQNDVRTETSKQNNSDKMDQTVNAAEQTSEFEGFDESDSDETESPSSTGNSPPNQASCCFCDFKSDDKLKLAIHVNVDHPDKSIYTCRDCLFIAKSKSEIKVHKKTHTTIAGESGDVYACKDCYFKTLYPRSFDRHKVLCTRIVGEKGFSRTGKYHCPLCTYKTESLDLYKEHLLNHVRHDTLTCPRCPFRTGRKDMYTFHLQTEHQLERNKTQCPYCDFSTRSDVQMENHLNVHKRENGETTSLNAINTNKTRALKSNRFKQTDVLEETNGTDANESDNCEQTDVDDDIKRTDIRKSNRTKQTDVYKAKIPKEFAHTSSYPSIETDSAMSYKKNHTGRPKKWSCMLCNLNCSSEEILVRHFQCHVSDRCINCPMCEFRSAEFPNFYGHMFRVHQKQLQ